MKNKITFHNMNGAYNVLVNGKTVAHISGGGGDYYLITGALCVTPHADRKFIARFKYAKAFTCVKDFAKFVFTHVSAEEAAQRSSNTPPLTWAQELGYIPYHRRKRPV